MHRAPQPSSTRSYRFSLWICDRSNPYLHSPELHHLLSTLPVIVDGQLRGLHRPAIPGLTATLPWIRADFADHGEWRSEPVVDQLGRPCQQAWTVFSYAVALPEPLPSWGSFIAFDRASPHFAVINRWLALDDVNVVVVGGSRLLPLGRTMKLWTSTYGTHIIEGKPLEPQLGTQFLCCDIVDLTEDYH